MNENIIYLMRRLIHIIKNLNMIEFYHLKSLYQLKLNKKLQKFKLNYKKKIKYLLIIKKSKFLELKCLMVWILNNKNFQKMPQK